MKKIAHLLYIFILIPLGILAQNPYQVNTSATNVSETNPEWWVQPVKYKDLKGGLRFMVLPAVKGSAYELNFKTENSDKRYLVKDFGGKIFVYKKQQDITLTNGDIKTRYYFDCDANPYFLEEYKPKNEHKIVNWNEPSIVWLDEIDAVKKKLEGKTVWINTNTWKYMQDGTTMYKDNPARFSEVTILQVGAGSYSNYPVRVLFRDEKDQRQYFVDGHVSGTLGFLNYPEDNLQNIIAFAPFEKLYPNVRKEFHDAIKNREIIKGMNEADCYLSLGNATQREIYTEGKDNYVVLSYRATDTKPYYLYIELKNDKVTEIRKSE